MSLALRVNEILTDFQTSHIVNLKTVFNSLWPIVATWQHRSGLTLVQVMVLLSKPSGVGPSKKNHIELADAPELQHQLISIHNADPQSDELDHNNWTWLLHDDVINWKHFPRYWPFVRGTRRSPVNSPQKANDAEL